MKNTVVKTTSIDLANNLTIDREKKIIRTSKQLLKAASKYGTEEYKLFNYLLKEHPDFEIVATTQKKRKSLNITFDFMTKYISKHDESGEVMNEFLVKRGLKADEDGEINAEKFADIRTWFLEKYSEVRELGSKAA